MNQTTPNPLEIEFDTSAESTARNVVKLYKAKDDIGIDRPTVEAMCNGDDEAFHKIYVRSYDNLKKFLTIILHSPEDAEEVVHDIFLHIIENRTKIDASKSFKGYLFTIAKTKAFNLLARRKLDDKYYNHRQNSLAGDYAATPEDVVMTDELALIISLYVDNLPPQRKQAFELSRIEGKSIGEIADIMNLSPQTVKNYLQTAMNGLRELITLFVVLFLS